jgi:hypothetical protein
MPHHDTGFGICFTFPDDWELCKECADDQVSFTVCSPGTAFWSVTIMPDGPNPDDVIRAAVAAYEQEYDELDVRETVDDANAGRSPGAEVNFVCLDLTSTAILKACRLGRLTLLTLYQSDDADFEQLQPVMEQINASLRLASDRASDAGRSEK